MAALDAASVCGRVNRLVDTFGGASAIAGQLGVSRQHVSAMLNGKTPFSPALLALAGIYRICLYETIEPEAAPPDWNRMKQAVRQ